MACAFCRPDSLGRSLVRSGQALGSSLQAAGSFAWGSQLFNGTLFLFPTCFLVAAPLKMVFPKKAPFLLFQLFVWWLPQKWSKPQKELVPFFSRVTEPLRVGSRGSRARVPFFTAPRYTFTQGMVDLLNRGGCKSMVEP